MRTLIDITILFIIRLSKYWSNEERILQELEYPFSDIGDAPFIVR